MTKLTEVDQRAKSNTHRLEKKRSARTTLTPS